VKIPAWMLTGTGTIYPREGNSAHGPKWGVGVAVDCYAELSNKQVVTPQGQTATSALFVMFAPDTALVVGDKFTMTGTDYICAQCINVDGHHIEADFTRLAAS
jgi:hypothetical protein